MYEKRFSYMSFNTPGGHLTENTVTHSCGGGGNGGGRGCNGGGIVVGVAVEVVAGLVAVVM